MTFCIVLVFGTGEEGGEVFLSGQLFVAAYWCAVFKEKLTALQLKAEITVLAAVLPGLEFVMRKFGTNVWLIEQRKLL